MTATDHKTSQITIRCKQCHYSVPVTDDPSFYKHHDGKKTLHKFICNSCKQKKGHHRRARLWLVP